MKYLYLSIDKTVPHCTDILVLYFFQCSWVGDEEKEWLYTDTFLFLTLFCEKWSLKKNLWNLCWEERSLLLIVRQLCCWYGKYMLLFVLSPFLSFFLTFEGCELKAIAQLCLWIACCITPNTQVPLWSFSPRFSPRRFLSALLLVASILLIRAGMIHSGFWDSDSRKGTFEDNTSMLITKYDVWGVQKKFPKKVRSGTTVLEEMDDHCNTNTVRKCLNSYYGWRGREVLCCFSLF